MNNKRRADKRDRKWEVGGQLQLEENRAWREGIIILWYQEASPLIPLEIEQRLVGKLN